MPLVRSAATAGLVSLMAASGVHHLVAPVSYRRIVPPVLGSPAVWVAASGAAELACAALLATRRTRHSGGLATMALLLAVLPANIQMARDGGLPGAPLRLDTRLGAWLRVPMQVPLLYWAWWVSRTA